ncbi:MAG: NADPH-dependent FMN reductase [Alphaproteobacteria bacterium]
MILTDKPRIGVIIGSARDARFADKPANWFVDLASARDDLDFELLDLRDFDLPFFNEMASNLWMPSQDPKAVHWQETLAGFDGFVVVTAEYNHSISAVLKLQMVPLRNAVHIGGGEFMKVSPLGENAPMEAIAPVIEPSATAMLDELAWWVGATRTARLADTADGSV